MKKYSSKAFALLFISLPLLGLSQNTQVMDIPKMLKNNGFNVFNRETTAINEQGHMGVRLSKNLGEGVAWVNGVDFSNGTIEFDVRGEDTKQRSFVGFAFHGVDNTTFDAIYLRPFQFREQNPILKSHSLQYISLPNFTWQVLREKFPNKFESGIDPSPDPNSWVHVKIVIQNDIVSTYINGNATPSMVITKVTAVRSGKIGFYVADVSGGDFANLSITKAN